MENQENQDERDSCLPAPQPLENNKESIEKPENKIIKNESINNNKQFLEEKITYDEKMKKAISKIDSISNSSCEYLKSSWNEFTNKNSKFIKEIKMYNDNIISKYSKLFNLNDKASQEEGKNGVYKSDIEKHIQLMERIHDIYSQIFDSIKQNLEIMSRFLDKFVNISQNIDKCKPIQEFLFEEFSNTINCWLFMKIDFGKFDFNEALNKSNLDQNFKNFVSKISKDKIANFNKIAPKLEIEGPKGQKKLEEKKENEIKLIPGNLENKTDLNLTNVEDVSSNIDDKIDISNLKSFFVKNSTFKNAGFLKEMKNLEKLTIKSCVNFQIDILEYLPEKLKILNLENNNFVNLDLENILKGIFSSNKNILENLEYLSFAGNNLTRVDLSVLPMKTFFNGLISMNFQKNKIYKFIFNPENFPNLKFINLCKNNLNKSYLMDLKTLDSLESGNGFLFEPELCQKYYNKLKEKLKINEKDLFKSNYLNISFMPKVQALDYFKDFIINEEIIVKLKKLDLSYNSLDCNTFFKFTKQKKGFLNLRSLNLNGNELDDTFFEKFEPSFFSKLEHLYLNYNKIGSMEIKINYKDNIPIDGKYKNNSEKELVYKLRVIYNFIQRNAYLNKLTITKNPISEYYSVVPEQNNNADKSDKYIKKDKNNKIIINCLFSLLIKIRDELLMNEEEKLNRNGFNLRFDCRSNVNRNSENYPYSDKPIVYKK